MMNLMPKFLISAAVSRGLLILGAIVFPIAAVALMSAVAPWIYVLLHRDSDKNDDDSL